MSSLYINVVADALKPALPQIITKEELMNYFIHELNFNGQVTALTTVKDLITAAHIAGKQVKGKSRLEINVTVKEQLGFIRNAIPVLDQESFKANLYSCKDEIIKSYNSGVSTLRLAKAYGCCATTMGKYLKKFGVTLRPKKGCEND